MQLLTRAVIVVATFAAFASSSFAQSENSPGPLRKVADYQMANARMGAAVAALGNHLYIFGGSGGSAAIYHAERLDLATGQTELLSPRFLSRRFHSAVEHGGKIYLFGGQGYALPGRVLETRVEVYDPATNTVEIVGETSDPRQLAGTVKLGQEVWIIGGGRHRTNGTYSQTNEVAIYDLSGNTWRKGPPMPTPRETKAVTVGQFVLVAGGYEGRKKHRAVEMYVPQEQVWKRLPDLGQDISAHSAAVLGPWLFLFGDYDVGSTVLAYELPTRKTTRIKPGFTESRHTAAITIGERIYVVGGAALATDPAGGSGMLRANRNLAQAEGTERSIVQVFELTQP